MSSQAIAFMINKFNIELLISAIFILEKLVVSSIFDLNWMTKKLLFNLNQYTYLEN